ncbi:MAG: hypothetical protein A2138_15040 [Deltaproteobacteria bacterium RBG_16_71_12]|nr:MAG: hypothetical protein A2138_15040 [Deltaproteobacteria bacterium RBG_16_71_12]
MSEARFTLKVDGMHCGNCVRRVKAALEAMDGVTLDDVEVGRVTGSFDTEATNPSALAEAVTRAGYQATAVDGATS